MDCGIQYHAWAQSACFWRWPHSLGLPGLGNFIGEFLALIGAYQANIPVTAIAVIGLVFATMYSLWIIQRTFHGSPRESWDLPDLNVRNMGVMVSMILVLIWLGLFPKPVLDTARPALQNIEQTVVTLSQVESDYSKDAFGGLEIQDPPSERSDWSELEERE